MKHAITVAALVLAGLFLGAPPASAHSELLSTTPAKSAQVTEAISAVTLTFNEGVDGRFSTVVVSGPGGVSYSTGTLTVTDATVSQPVRPLATGTYQVTWRVVSADGHPISGEFSFSALRPGVPALAAAPTGVAEPKRGGDFTAPGWLWWGAGGGTVVAVVALGLVLGRRRS